MAILKILTAPDPRLKRISEPVDKVDDNVRKLYKDMVDTMNSEGTAIGLAAPQVGVLKRIIVIDYSKYDEVKRPKGFYPHLMANPAIVEASEAKLSDEEACFSVPTLGIQVPRAEKVKVEYIDYNNTKQAFEAEGYLARLIQHEIDHLNGVLTLDYLTPLKRDVAVRKLIKVKKLQG
ncbi:MAG: def2 [Rickettsiaceae bacterium]|jgi:peptide deformylase|nr:def2 [Rickettsiaceae bacterium]